MRSPLGLEDPAEVRDACILRYVVLKQVSKIIGFHSFTHRGVLNSWVGARVLFPSNAAIAVLNPEAEEGLGVEQ